MFAGIIESKVLLKSYHYGDQTLTIQVERPTHFNDLNHGDSIAVNGICLTVEHFELDSVTFTLGYETLKILGKHVSSWLSKPFNLERSLQFGSRVHGHFVTGHVESLVKVTFSESLGENWILRVLVPAQYAQYCLKKGSMSLHGVSLTINEKRSISLNCKETDRKTPKSTIDDFELEVCLIPETQKRTNLVLAEVNDHLCFEPDSMTKSIVEIVENHLSQSPS